MRAREFTAVSKWDGQALGEKQRPEARGQLAAQWDVVFGPGRWEEEVALDKFQWQCLTCG